MATDRDALKALVAVLRERHHGRMPHEVQVAYDEACAALAAPQVEQQAATIDPNNCALDVYGRGESVGLFDISKETANAICAGISTATGARVDWHYFGGRVHIKALPAAAQPAPADDALPAELAAALDRMDALLDPALDLLTAGPDSATAKGSRDDMRTIRDALAARASPSRAAVPEGWRQLLQQSEENFVHQFGASVSAAWVYRDLEELLTSQPAAVDVGAAPDTVLLPRAEWEELEFWLDRCESKGHLDNCPDLIEPYEALCKAIAARATPGATHGN